MPAMDESLLTSFHFMMLKYDLTKSPGQWRPGAVWVEDQDGQVTYEAPPRGDVEHLVSEALAEINAVDGDPIVRAAMAHLNLALIHPFSDGNGRMARCVQSFVLASEGLLSPEFLSMEETEALWDRCEQLARRHHLPDRCVGALCDASRGWRVRRSLYVKAVRSSAGEEITDDTATRDLRAMSKAGLLDAVGEKRGRYYQPSEELRSIWREIRSHRRARGVEDPYELAQPPLPGLDS